MSHLYSATEINEIKKNAIVEYAVAVIADLAEVTKQEDSPVYEGDKEVDNWVRLSEVTNIINKHLNELANDDNGNNHKKVNREVATKLFKSEVEKILFER